MSSFQIWIVFLLALLHFNSCAFVYSYPTSGAHLGHEPKSWTPPNGSGCYHNTPPPQTHRHRKTPPPPLLPPLPPAAFYFFSPPPPYSKKTPRPVGPFPVPPPRFG
ncbi:unnamed protein product [Lupinus luteus]|uniref:Uncharacterized protein n=1 Tax=Lupinus luteus TaxID=3873 RepID=A0AAV1W992_LUPLU